MRRDDHVLGPPDAGVSLLQYGDYECPHCARASLVVEVVLAELEDTVRFAFRHFPISEKHAHAQAAAEAAESVAVHAGESAFWAMHAILFANQDALEIDDLLTYADAAGADPLRVAADLSAGAMRARVERHRHAGLVSGVAGTPTFFINGRRFHGDWSDADALTAALRVAAQMGLLH
jgi:protein-disulfide isomerase